MENIFKFQPLFATSERIILPREAIQQVRTQALEALLSEVDGTQDSIRDVVEHTMIVARLLLSDPVHRGPIVRVLAASGYKLCGDPVLLVAAMISEWFRESSPYMTRIVNTNPASDTGTRLANLGLMAMLWTMEGWNSTPEGGGPKLRGSVLVANAVTTILCGAYVIFRGFGPKVEGAWNRSVKLAPPSVCIWAFLKSAWQVARTGGDWANGGPGTPFGANTEEIRMRRDGRRLLVKIGRISWEDPAYWHPCKKVPGSPWNKFFKNKNQPIFEGSRPSATTQIMHRLPSTALNFAETFEAYYDTIYEGMDRREFARVTLSAEELELQHIRLASASGLWYPDSELDEDDATEIYNAFQDYLDVVPLAKRPTTDSRGNLTLPFLTSTIRALRFDREPTAIEEDLWVMAFGGTEQGVVIQ